MPTPPRSETARTAPGTDDRGPAFLVVEDDPDNAELVLTRIRHLGGRADHAMTGEAALELCRRNRYDTIIVDHILPGMSGSDFIRAITVNGDRRDAWVLVSSIVDDLPLEPDEIDGFFVKPYPLAELDRVIRRPSARTATENEMRT